MRQVGRRDTGVDMEMDMNSNAFERCLTEVLSMLMQVEGNRLDEAIQGALRAAGEFMDADRAYVFFFRGGSMLADNTHEWCAEGVGPRVGNLKGIAVDRQLPYFAERMRRRETFYVPEVAALPPEAEREKAHLEAHDIRSLIVVPMIRGEAVTGFLGFDCVQRRSIWPDRAEQLLRLMSEAIATSVARERAERALRESEEWFRAIFTHSQDGIVLTDAQTLQFAMPNPRFCEMLGYSAEELSGMSVDDIHPSEDLAHVKAMISWQVAGDVSLAEGVRIERKDGSTFYADINAAPLEVNGRAFLVSMYRDVTERKQLEEQLRQAQRMEAIGRLAGGVAHDFNNILTGIKGFAGFALEQMSPGSQPHQDLTEAVKLCDRAADLTYQLLAFSRRQALEPVVLDLNRLLAERVKMLKRILGEDIDIQFVPGANLGHVRADPGQIEQVVMNLAVNARDAMPNGGKLTIETANVELDLAYTREHAEVEPGPYVMMAVSDTGSGMDRETRQHVFEPFFTTKEPGKGTGLGLSTVYGIVKQHGGSIWVYSEPGKGTTFKVYLARVSSQAEEPPKETESVVGGTETILLVEDDAAVRAIGCRNLEALGYTVLCASCAREAEQVAQARRGRIDLLLTDVVMPDRGGRELHQSLSADRPELKVLYMSGYTENAIVHRGVLDKDIAFLQKPFEPADLARKVRQVLDG